MTIPRVRALAYQEVKGAIRRKELVRPKKCEQCGKTTGRIEAHHDDHAKPFDVRWLCSSCNCRERWIASMANQMEPEMWDKVKRKAAEQGITIRDVVFSLLAAWLLEENI